MTSYLTEKPEETVNIRMVLTTVQEVSFNLDELVREYGPKARTKAFLEDLAIGNRKDGVIIKSEFDVEFIKPPVKKVRKGIGSY